MIKTLDKYIIKKYLGTFFFTIGLLMSIVIVFDLSEKMDELLSRDAPLLATIKYYLNFIPYFINLYAPLFAFIAVIFFTSKMAARSEYVAMLASGTNYHRILRPYFIASFILFVFSLSLSNFIIPRTSQDRIDFDNLYLNPYTNKDRNIHRQIEKGVFMYIDFFNTKANVGYKFSLERFSGSSLLSKINSESIRWDSVKKVWHLNDYQLRVFSSKGDKLVIGKSLDTTINVKPEDFGRWDNAFETMDYFQLNRQIEKVRLFGSSNIMVFLIEKYRRVSAPFSIFILTAIGMFLSSRKSKKGVGIHLGVGVGLAASYIFFGQVSTQFSLVMGMSPILAVWIPNLLFMFVAAYLYVKAPK